MTAMHSAQANRLTNCACKFNFSTLCSMRFKVACGIIHLKKRQNLNYLEQHATEETDYMLPGFMMMHAIAIKPEMA